MQKIQNMHHLLCARCKAAVVYWTIYICYEFPNIFYLVRWFFATYSLDSSFETSIKILWINESIQFVPVFRAQIFTVQTISGLIPFNW